MTAAILLAGGRGKRAGCDIPKQYIVFRGHMLIFYSYRILSENKSIDDIIVAAEPAWRDRIISELILSGINTDKLLAFSDPGRSRQETVKLALEILSDRGYGQKDFCLIHDSARPFLTKTLLNRVLSCRGYDGVMPYISVKDTVYKKGNGMIDCLMNRDEIVSGQTPEMFRFGKYLAANRALSEDELLYKVRGSSEPAVKSGMKIGLVSGDEKNIKITTAEDIMMLKLMENEKDGL